MFSYELLNDFVTALSTAKIGLSKASVHLLTTLHLLTLHLLTPTLHVYFYLWYAWYTYFVRLSRLSAQYAAWVRVGHGTEDRGHTVKGRN